MRRVVTILLAVLFVAVPGSASAAPAPHERVKYHVVADPGQGGAAETLPVLAGRYLNDPARSREIFALNADRAQPDGRSLTDPEKLTPGWVLVLPWDAVGEGVRYGRLPDGAAGPAAGSPGCPAAVPTVVDGSRWGQLRMAPERVWIRTRGAGVVVAVVDTGVDARVPHLTGRVLPGADVVAGNPKGDTDCVGSGTALAAIIAGSAPQSGPPAGMAPAATVMPLRVVQDGRAIGANVATAVEVAVSAGARVLALGGFADLADPLVTGAIADAVGRDVVVVVGAREASATGGPPVEAVPGVLRVGAVGISGELVRDYRAGDVDLVAPTVAGDLPAAQVAGGTAYAVAFVAGAAALMRAAEPDLSSAVVAKRLTDSAGRLGTAQPDTRYGWGMLDVGGALGMSRAAAPAQPDGGGGPVLLVVFAVMVLAAVGATLWLRPWKAWRGREAAPAP